MVDLFIDLASIVEEKNIASFNAIKHIDLQRVVTLYSSILAGSNANQIVNTAEIALSGFETKEGVSFKFTGEIKEQDENQEFLLRKRYRKVKEEQARVVTEKFNNMRHLRPAAPSTPHRH